jgi:APA family basic amino acid/polyamine antiporter
MEATASPTHEPALQRRFGLLQATALNMSNMIGVGPFITIPLLMSALGGPQSMLGWFLALIICMADGLIWSELGAAMPGSGGSYIYLRQAFGPATWGRLMAFLFIWQFIFSGPLEIASGYIGFCDYLSYVWPNRHVFTFDKVKIDPLAIGMGLVTIFLLYRRIGSIGKITVTLWVGTLMTTAIVIFLGATHFDPAKAFDFPPNAFHFSFGFFLGLGSAARIGLYDYLGYYDVCYIGDEVREPQRVIPRSVLISLVGVALIYICINLSIVGVVPWREFVPAENNPKANYVVSIFIERLLGRPTAILFTGMVLWTAFASVFALMLGYSRIPYAAALDGYFFRVFGKLHPTKNFPYVSLLLIGFISIICSFFSLGAVIDALIITRIVIQFIGQTGAVVLLRRANRGVPLPFKMWLYPLPCIIALLGWIFMIVTTDAPILLGGFLSLVAGLIAFLIWSWRNRTWPFAVRPAYSRQP